MHRIFATYLSDPEFEALYSDEAFLQKMLLVEATLARVQAVRKLIPPEAAEEINELLKNEPVWDLKSITESTRKNGIPVIGFLDQARKQLSAKSAGYLHWGATSQDISDTALVLVLRDATDLVVARLITIIGKLKKLEKQHEHTLTLARTRNQPAVPITFSQKVSAWRRPLERLLKRLSISKKEISIVQLAGAGGNLDALGRDGVAVAKALATALALRYEGNWQNQRDRLAEMAGCLSAICAALGKMGQDVLVLSQSEIGELREQADGGKSSSMPHKDNPVLSEALLALARHAISLNQSLQLAQLHQNERDGAALALEWMAWPQLLNCVGAALAHGLAISTNLVINTRRMQVNLEHSGGLVYAERATYILSAHMSREEARNLTAMACRKVQEDGITLPEALELLAGKLGIEWKSELS